MRDLRESLRAGTPVYGIFLQISDAFAAEAIASLGYDWLLIDMEHGPVSIDVAAAMCTAIRAQGAVPFVRAAWNESSQIQRALDLGAGGLVVPVVNTAADARTVVADAKFPPLGERSRGGVRAQLAHDMDAMTYFEKANAAIPTLVQIETMTAVQNVEEIVAVDGVDGVFLGPNDLAASMGRRWPDAWGKNDDYTEALRRVATVARGAGKIAGFLARDPQMAKDVAAMGYDFIGVGSDINALIGATKTALGAARA